jgi:hypothetical protein
VAVQYLETVHTFNVSFVPYNVKYGGRGCLILLCSLVWNKELTGRWRKLHNEEHHDLLVTLAIYY